MPQKNQIAKRVMIQPGEQLWEDRNHHALRARLARDVARGRVAAVTPMRVTPWGSASVTVKLIHNPRRQVALRLGVVLALFATIVGIGVLVWMSRYFLLLGAAFTLAVMAGKARGSGGSILEVIQIVRIKR